MSGQDKSNPMLWLATQTNKIALFREKITSFFQRKHVMPWKRVATCCQCIVALHFVVNALCHDFNPLCLVVNALCSIVKPLWIVVNALGFVVKLPRIAVNTLRFMFWFMISKQIKCCSLQSRNASETSKVLFSFLTQGNDFFGFWNRKEKYKSTFRWPQNGR